MNSEEFEQVREVFIRAVSIDSTEGRERFLEDACGGNATFRSAVEELLRNDGDLGSFLEDPAVAELDEDVTITDSVALSEKEGDRIGRYKLLQKLGEGGMGTVYMAEQLEPVARKVALKIIKLGMDTKRVIARFEAERQALAMMDHPNIARVLDGGATETGRPYFVMELVQGVSITQFCDKNKLSLRDRLGLFTQVCRAIQSAHQKGVIHRDIKPNNVMISLHYGEPMVKVIDFGIAKATNQKLTERTLFTEYAQIIGTPAYMSPEQAEMSTIDVDSRTDIYSLGTLLYELLTGTTPISQRRLRSVAYGEMQRIIAEEEPEKPSTRLSTFAGEQKTAFLRSHGSELPTFGNLVRGDLDWITMKCLEKDRRRRYDTPNELAADVERYLNHDPVSAVPPTLGYQIQKLYRKHKGVAQAAALVGALLVVASAFSTYQAFRAAQAEQRANDEATVARTQAAIAEAVNEFLNDDVLGQVDPTIQPDKDVKLRTVLDRASESIEGRFQEQPLVEASIRFTIGQAYHRLTDMESATPHINRSLEIRKRELGAGAIETLESEIESIGLISNSFLRRGGAEANVEELVRRGQEALRLARKSAGPDAPISLRVMELLAGLYRKIENVAAELEIRREIVERRRRVLGTDDLETLKAAYKLAEILNSSGSDRGEARRLIAEARTLFERRSDLDPESEFILKLEWFESSLLFSARKFEQALVVNEAALDKCERRYGENHATTLNCLQNRGGIYLAMNDFDRAIEIRREIVRRYSESYGATSGATLASIGWLNWTYREVGRMGEAEALLENTLKQVREENVEKSTNYHELLASLIGLYLGDGRRAKAIDTYIAEYGLAMPMGRSDFSRIDLVTKILSAMRHEGEPPGYQELMEVATDYSQPFTDPESLKARGGYSVLTRFVSVTQGLKPALGLCRLYSNDQPEGKGAWYSRSVYELLAGDGEGYSLCCQKLLEMTLVEELDDLEQAPTLINETLKTCLLRPDLSPLTESQADLLYKKAKKQRGELRSGRGSYPWIHLSIVFQDYRSGRYQEVQAQLSEFKVDSYSPRFRLYGGYGIVLLLSAMSEFKLGNVDQAQALLEEAAVSTSHFLPDGLKTDPSCFVGGEYARYFLIRQEAERLILGPRDTSPGH